MCETLQLNWKLPSAALANNNKTGINKDKYSLRACSIKKRVEAEHRKSQPRQPKKRGPKPRPKSAPMSRYRRKTANLRERQRMGEINNAFEDLRERIPSLAVAGKGRCEKMTKINVLHVAINYIRALENILHTGDAGVNVYGTAVVQSPRIVTNIDNDGEIAPPKRRNDSGESICPSSSPCSSSQENETLDDDVTNQDNGEEEEDFGECPDWTELTSTLELSSPEGKPRGMNNNHYTKPPPPPTPSRGNLDTLLTLSALTSQQHHRSGLSSPEILTKKPPLMPQQQQQSNKVTMTMMTGVSIGNSKGSGGIFTRQTSFPDLGDDDLFADDGGELTSLEEFCDINFIHEDPFQLIV